MEVLEGQGLRIGPVEHFGLRLAVGVAVAVVSLLAAVPGHAVPKAGGLDLRLDSTDVAPAPPPPFRSFTTGPADESGNGSVGAIDQAPVSETPNRHKAGTGTLDNLAGDAELLKQLLEDKTIPLFRIRMQSPF
jgi:hypothetical protein